MIGVCIVTYNQEAYIAQAIESVLKQEDCPEVIRLYIGNDCSTDRTTVICEDFVRRYPNTITLINNDNNLGLVRNTLNVLTRIKEDGNNYVAMLDGDDYWCDCHKLQKQLEILKSDPSVGFVHTDLSYLLGETLLPGHKKTPPSGYVFNDMGHFSIGNCTVMFRSGLLDTIDFNELYNYGFLSLDGVMYTLFSAVTNFCYIDEITAVWRRGHISVSNTRDEEKQIAYLENEKAMWSYLDQKFPGRYGYSDEAWQLYHNYKVFNIAYNFNDYSLAHSLSRAPMSNSDFKFFVKRLCASNRLLFRFWCHLKGKRASYSITH